ITLSPIACEVCRRSATGTRAGTRTSAAREPETRAAGWSGMVTKTSKTMADYRERADSLRTAAETAASAAVRRALLNVAARYDEIADGAGGSARCKRPKQVTRR